MLLLVVIVDVGVTGGFVMNGVVNYDVVGVVVFVVCLML